MTVYTYFQVREDAMTLYGFLHRQDREMFKQLLGVNGIGPKGALGILSVMRPDDLRIAIVSGDAKAISRAPGIGAKTAQRLILDLKDKVDLEEVMMASFGGGKEAASDTGTGASVAGMAASAKEAVAALTALGYTNMEASRAVKKVEITENMSVEDILKASLKHLHDSNQSSPKLPALPVLRSGMELWEGCVNRIPTGPSGARLTLSECLMHLLFWLIN